MGSHFCSFLGPVVEHVDVEFGRFHAGMPEQVSDGFGGGATVGGEAGEGMPEVVDPEVLQLGVFADFRPRLVDFGEAGALEPPDKEVGIAFDFRDGIENGHGDGVQLKNF